MESINLSRLYNSSPISLQEDNEEDESSGFDQVFGNYSVEREVEASEFDYDKHLQNVLESLSLNFEGITNKLSERIADIDVGTDSGVNDILHFSERLESNLGLKKSIDEVSQKLEESNGDLSDEDYEQINSVIDEAKKVLKKEELQDLKDRGYKGETANLKNLDEAEMIDIADYKVLDENDIELDQVTGVIKDIESVAVLDEIQLDNLDVDLDSLRLELSQGLEFEASSSTASTNPQFANFTHNFSSINSVAAKVQNSPVKITKLPDFVSKETINAPSGIKQELKLMLNPENLGKVDMTITKDGNNVSIKLVVAKDQAMEQLQTRVADIKAMLKEKGFDAKIELSKFENSSGNAPNQEQDQSHNEASDEQKKRFLNTAPAWLENSESFELPSSD